MHDLDSLGDTEEQLANLHVNKLIIWTYYGDCFAVATRIGTINEYVDFLSKRRSKFTCVPQFGIEPLWAYCLNQSNPSVT